MRTRAMFTIVIGFTLFFSDLARAEVNTSADGKTVDVDSPPVERINLHHGSGVSAAVQHMHSLCAVGDVECVRKTADEALRTADEADGRAKALRRQLERIRQLKDPVMQAKLRGEVADAVKKATDGDRDAAKKAFDAVDKRLGDLESKVRDIQSTQAAQGELLAEQGKAVARLTDHDENWCSAHKGWCALSIIGAAAAAAGIVGAAVVGGEKGVQHTPVPASQAIVAEQPGVGAQPLGRSFVLQHEFRF